MLSAASWLECDDLVVPYFHRCLSAQVKAVEPIGAALPNSEIFRCPAAEIDVPGAPKAVLGEPDESVLAEILDRANVGMSFTELALAGTVWPSSEPVTPFDRDASLAFPTPSGRIELVSEPARRDGHGVIAVPDGDPRPQGRRLRLHSPAAAASLNSMFATDARAAGRGAPTPTSTLSLSLAAADADARGLTAGALARVVSAAGSLALPVRISPDLPAGVALIPKGGWPKLIGGANVNALTTSQPTDMATAQPCTGSRSP